LRPLYRGIGLGQKLISLLMEFLRVSDYSYCFLYTLPELKNAIALYEKNGFEFTEENLSMELGKPVLLKQYVIKLNHKVASLFNN
jgi:ribosomal protein S18 acetylase RimI-like enzyme